MDEQRLRSLLESAEYCCWRVERRHVCSTEGPTRTRCEPSVRHAYGCIATTASTHWTWLRCTFLPVSFTKKAASSMRRPLKSCLNFLGSVSGPQIKRRFVFTFAEWLMVDTSSFKLQASSLSRIRSHTLPLRSTLNFGQRQPPIFSQHISSTSHFSCVPAVTGNSMPRFAYPSLTSCVDCCLLCNLHGTLRGPSLILSVHWALSCKLLSLPTMLSNPSRRMEQRTLPLVCPVVSSVWAET